MGKVPAQDKVSFLSIIGNSHGHGDAYLWLPISSSLLLVKESESFKKTDYKRQPCFVSDT